MSVVPQVSTLLKSFLIFAFPPIHLYLFKSKPAFLLPNELNGPFLSSYIC